MKFLCRVALVAGLSGSILAPAFAQSPAPLRERLAERMAERRAEGGSGSEIETAGSGRAAPIVLPAGARQMIDLAWGPDAAQRMDVYLPAGATPARPDAPVILMVHGGGWRTGDKQGRGVANNKVRRWVARGFVVVSTNYRLLPAADPLVQADDVARAIAFVQAQAAGWGGDGSRLVLMGHSAGAHLVTLLGAAPAGRAAAQGARPWLGTVALDSAVMDVPAFMSVRHLPMYDHAFGSDPAFWRAASPLHAMEAGGALPLLAVCSTRRFDRPCVAAEQLRRRGAARSARVEVLGQDLTHAQINDQLGLPGAYTDAVEAFMASLDPALRERLGR